MTLWMSQMFLVLTVTNELYVIDTTNSQPGSTWLVETTKDTIIPLVVLLKANFKVDFAVGRVDDSCFGDILHVPDVFLFRLSSTITWVCVIALTSEPQRKLVLLSYVSHVSWIRADAPRDLWRT